MTVEEIILKLSNLPKDAIVTYRHNKYGRIDIDVVEFSQEKLYSDNYIGIVTFSGKFEEDK